MEVWSANKMGIKICQCDVFFLSRNIGIPQQDVAEKDDGKEGFN
jgi:hypothetical protein